MFKDRIEAGKQLAERLTESLPRPAVVLALPRGGVPVAAEIARRHGLPLDLMLVRKVGLPAQRELAVAAIAGADGSELTVNADVAAMAGLSPEEIRDLAEPERTELRRRRTVYLGDRKPVSLIGKTAILVDDGIATGATTRAAIAATRQAGAQQIILAVPVAPSEVLDRLRREVDKIICLETPDPFHAVGAHFRDFPQVSDDEVTRTLAAFAPPA